jgi:hypothetical protein
MVARLSPILPISTFSVCDGRHAPMSGFNERLIVFGNRYSVFRETTKPLTTSGRDGAVDSTWCLVTRRGFGKKSSNLSRTLSRSFHATKVPRISPSAPFVHESGWQLRALHEAGVSNNSIRAWSGEAPRRVRERRRTSRNSRLPCQCRDQPSFSAHRSLRRVWCSTPAEARIECR